MIIKYTLENNQTPSYVTDGGYFYNDATEELIGVGTDASKEITQEQLQTYVLNMHTSPLPNTPFLKFNAFAFDSRFNTVMTEAEVLTMVNEWWTENA